MSKNIIKITIIFCLVISMVQLAPKKAHAVWGFGDTNVQVGDLSVSGLSNWAGNMAKHLKDFVLDKLAVVIAKAILHKLTLAVIDWINTGYQGNPAFITNPGDFFGNVADEIAGTFISNSGPLADLCSPFSLDVRLGLALEQGRGYSDNPYACTLTKAIKNTKNAVAGASVEGFVSGDFSQGGWPAFIAMNAEQQNNAAGAYLLAQSELRAKIESRHNNLTLDLQMGGGFRSFESCKDIPNTDLGNTGLTIKLDTADAYSGGDSLSQLNKKGDQSVVTGQDRFGNNSTVQKKVDPKTGVVKYQDCQTQTPGSAVASKLFANINSPELELAFADSMNAIISAAITQLVNSFMQKGLYALSGKGSGTNGQSYTQQALQEINAQTNQDLVDGTAQANKDASAATTQAAQNNKTSYDQAVNALTASKNALLTAAICFDGKAGQGQSNFATTQATAIRNLMAVNNVDSQIAAMTAKQQAANTQLSQVTQTSTPSQPVPTTLEDLQKQSVVYNDTINQSVATAAQVDTASAAKDLSDAQSLARQANQAAIAYQASCDAYPAQQIPVYITP